MNVRHCRLLLQGLSCLRDEGKHTDFNLVYGDARTPCHKVVLAVYSQRMLGTCLQSSVNFLEMENNPEYLVEKLYNWTNVGLEDLDVKMSRAADELDIEFLVKSKQVQVIQSRLDIMERARLRVFSEQLLELWRNEVLTDVILDVGGASFRCHRPVLAAMSGYFDAMFSSGMKESEDHIAIELHGFDKHVVENILSYIYTGKADIDNANADLMFAASVYFQIKPLRNLCERFLCTHTDVDNCVDVLALAECYSCKNLADNILNFIKENIVELLGNKSFQKLNSHTLQELISSDDLIVPGEEGVLNLILQWFDRQDNQSEESLSSLLYHVRCSQIRRESRQRICGTNPHLAKYSSCQTRLLQVDEHVTSDSYRNDHVLLVVRPNHFSDDVDIVCYSFMQSAWFALNQITNFNPGGSPGICFHDNCVYISGGSGNLNNFVKYDCRSNEWIYLQRMGFRRFGHCMCGVGEDIFVIGGKSMPNDTFNTIQKYSIGKGAWSKEGELRIPVSDASCACVASQILIFGGSQSIVTFSHAIQCYDLKTRTCTEIGSFPKGILTGIMRICSNEEYFFHVTAEGKLLQSSRTDPYESAPELIGTISQRLMMTAYSVVYYKGSLLLISDTKTAQREAKVIRYSVTETKQLQCDIKKLPFPPDSNQYFAVVVNINKRHFSLPIMT